MLLWLILSSTVFLRQPIPLDETRYLSVAWEMWLRNDYLLPFLNGQTYSHKPPLLFWLYQAGWLVFGINDWWPRLIGPMCALANLVLVKKLATKLWPDLASATLLAPWILISTLLWTLFATSGMFDILLTCWVLLGMQGLFVSAYENTYRGWFYFAIAIGLGLLTKGPVIFLHLLPTAILLSKPPATKTGIWFSGLLLSIVSGILMALCWAIPAAVAGGSDYASAIFWHQSADRALGSHIHARPVYWYLPLLPLIFFPWIIWPRFWTNLLAGRFAEDKGMHLCLAWLASTLLIFSLLPSKQIHYLIPALPAFALLVARVLSNGSKPGSISLQLCVPLAFALIGIFLIFMPLLPILSQFKWVQALDLGWGIGVMTIAALLTAATLFFKHLSEIALSTALVSGVYIGLLFFFEYTGLAYNLKPAALTLKSLQEQGVSCAFIGDYQGQLHFLGRLTQPLPTLPTSQASAWAELHTNGCLISLEKQPPLTAMYFQAHREYWLVFRSAHESALVRPI